MNIISREEWGARPPGSVTETDAREIFLHHSVGSGMVDKDGDGDKGDDYMRQMQSFHMDSRGWRDLAYNFAIDPDGLEVYEGRGWGVLPGSQCRHNSGTWSVVVMGDFRIRRPSDALLARIAELVDHGRQLGHLPDVPLQGHRDAPVTGDCTGSTCPGTLLYAQLPEINRLLTEDNMNAAQEAKLDQALALLENMPSTLVTAPLQDMTTGQPSSLGQQIRVTRSDVYKIRTIDTPNLVNTIEESDDESLELIAKAVNDELARRAAG